MIELLAEVDPWRLIELGCPDDEYWPEAEELMALAARTAEDVLATFVRWGSCGGDIDPSEYYFNDEHPQIRREDAEALAEGIRRIFDR